jgi:hypothetical protein
VTFSNFYGRVLLDAQGRLNLKDVVAKETGPRSRSRATRARANRCRCRPA